MSYRYLLFDADNTIFDFSACEQEIITALVHEHGLPEQTGDGENPVDTYRAINDRLWKKLERGEIESDELRVERFRLFLERLGGDARVEPEALNSEFVHRLSRCGELVSGARTILERCGPVYVVTNGFSSVQRTRLAAAGIEDYVAGLFISEEIGFAKPDVRFFESVLSRLDYPDRGECLVVGDSLTSDIQGGINAGIDTCWFDRNGGTHQMNGIRPNYRITSLSELPSIIRR